MSTIGVGLMGQSLVAWWGHIDPVLRMLNFHPEGKITSEGCHLCLKLISIIVKRLFEVVTSLSFKGVSTENDVLL